MADRWKEEKSRAEDNWQLAAIVFSLFFLVFLVPSLPWIGWLSLGGALFCWAGYFGFSLVWEFLSDLILRDE